MGPSFTWTFPLVRRFQSRNGILALGSRIIQKNRLESDNKQRSNTNSNGTTASQESESGDVLDEIEESIDSLNDNDLDFSQGEQDGMEIQITDGEFKPTNVQIDTGETVVWSNESGSDAKIESTNNNKISSDVLQPGETHKETFYGNVQTEFRNSLGDGNATGTVTVGDPDESIDVNPVPLNNDTNDGKRSMSQAAEEKQEMDIGFSQ